MSADAKSSLADENGKLKSTNILIYGRLVEIIKLDYYGKLRVFMFKCEWVYYVDGASDEGWSYVCHMKPRDIYDISDGLVYSKKSITKDIPFADQHLEDIDHIQLVREDVNEEADNNGSDNDDGRMSE